MKVRAAVLNNYNSELDIEDLNLAEPREEEVLVSMASASVCHTDVNAKIGRYSSSLPLPVVLGHEGSGIVKTVGPKVRKLRTGDHVVLSALVHCNKCKNCLSGRSYACERFDEIAFCGGLSDGTSRLSKDGRRISHFFAQSSFATASVVPENIAIKVPEDIPLEKLAPLGCGVQTGSGAVMNAGIGDSSSIAVFGCGGVGLSAIMGAKAIGLSLIVAVDVSKQRLVLAKDFGATHSINASEIEPVEEIRRISDGGVDYSIECAGTKMTILQAIMSARDHGTAILVGVVPSETEFPLAFSTLSKRTICGCVEGFANSETYIPRMIELFREGRFPFDKLSRTIHPLDRLNDAVHSLESGTEVKPIIKF